jgi:hypothetical protein
MENADDGAPNTTGITAGYLRWRWFFKVSASFPQFTKPER